MEAYFKAEYLTRNLSPLRVDISFSCPKGTMTTIVGPSGSGKSTALRLIAGLEKGDVPDDGKQTKIVLGGRDITHLPPGKRGIGMVFQKPTLFTHMRTDDNVAYGLRCAGMSKKESRARANDFLTMFNLEGFGARNPETLSGGEAQRVSLARTLIVQPDLVLFDEPLTALDAPLRKKLAAEIRALQTKIGFTGIMVTHDIAEAKTMGDFIILIRSGKITWQGKAADFREEML